MSKQPTNLTAAIEALNKEHGADVVVTLAQANKLGMLTTDRIPSGIYALDWIMRGGIPRRKITEFFGRESAGKTTAALHVAATVLNSGGRVLWIDAEHSIDQQWAKLHGLDIGNERFLLSQPVDGNKVGAVLHSMLMTDSFDLVVLDSIGAVVPNPEIDKGMEQEFMALVARTMGRITRLIWAGLAHREDGHKSTQTAILLLNQVRVKPGIAYGDPEYAPGGMAKDHSINLRVKFRKGSKLTVGEGAHKRVYGVTTGVLVTKNKVNARYMAPQEYDLIKSNDCPPFVTGQIDNAETLIRLALDTGIYKMVSKQSISTGKHEYRRTELHKRLMAEPEKAAKLWARLNAKE